MHLAEVHGFKDDEMLPSLKVHFARLPNDLPFSSERPDRVRAYHGRWERHRSTFKRTDEAFGCSNGVLDT